MEFVTNFRLNNWVNKHKNECNCIDDKQFIYSIQISNFIKCQSVKCIFCGKKFTYTKIL